MNLRQPLLSVVAIAALTVASTPSATAAFKAAGGLTAPPGGGPVNNFAPVIGYIEVNPACYSGSIQVRANSRVQAFAGGTFYVNEELEIVPGGAVGSFSHTHRWNISSDPLVIAGIVTTSSGSGIGTARVKLEINSEGNYRIITDVEPRVGTYQITTTGAAASSSTEDFHFAFADHHYSYVSPETPPEVVTHMRDSGPVNVFSGTLPASTGSMHIAGSDTVPNPFAGMTGGTQREWTLTLTCMDLAP